MLIHLTDIFTEEGKSVTKEVPLELDQISFQGESCHISEKSPVKLVLTSRGQGRAFVEAEAKVRIVFHCDRCLKDVEQEFDLHTEAELFSPDQAEGEEADAQGGFLDGYELDVDSLMSNEIFTCWPMKVLCREDCRGLCKVCGKDLNEGDCGCDTFVPDPRMAAIMDIFRESKEV